MLLKYDHFEQVRVDRYLADLKDPNLYSRTFIEKLIKSGNVKVNSQPVDKKSYLLTEGDVLELTLPESRAKQQLQPLDIPLEVVYEDEYLAIINKQAGISVHPGAGNSDATIVNALTNRYGDQLPSLYGDERPGIVHRLDKDTSGLMIIAKDRETLSKLSKLFYDRQVEKRYRAFVYGVPKETEGIIKTYIGRNTKDRKIMSVVKEGREAVTEYRIEMVFGCFSLLDINLKTGRTHQIRVHLNHIGNPIVGDRTYGINKYYGMLPQQYRKRIDSYIRKNILRQTLHSYMLKFTHPMTGNELRFTVELPNDMSKVIEWAQVTFSDETYSIE